MAWLMPLLLQGGQAMLPAILGKLFGGKDPRQKYMDQVNQILAPQNMAKLSNQFYQQNLSSPGFSQGQQAIAAGGNQASNMLSRDLGARGVGQSGTASVLSSMIPSMTGHQMSGLYSNAYNQAQGQAQNSITSQLGALQQKDQPWAMSPSQNQDLFAGGLAALGPILQQLFARTPQTSISPAQPGSRPQDVPIPQPTFGPPNPYGR